LKMQFDNRIAYRSGPSVVLSIPAAVVKYLEQQYDEPISELCFNLQVDGEKLIWTPNGKRTEPKGVAGRWKKK